MNDWIRTTCPSSLVCFLISDTTRRVLQRELAILFFRKNEKERKGKEKMTRKIERNALERPTMV